MRRPKCDRMILLVRRDIRRDGIRIRRIQCVCVRARVCKIRFIMPFHEIVAIRESYRFVRNRDKRGEERSNGKRVPIDERAPSSNTQVEIGI